MAIIFPWWLIGEFPSVCHWYCNVSDFFEIHVVKQSIWRSVRLSLLVRPTVLAKIKSHPYTHSNPTNIHTLHPNALRHLFQVSRDTSGQQQTPTDTKEHQQTLPDTQKGCSRICGGLCWHQMAFAEVWWCLMTSLTVLCCQQMLKGCLKNSSKGIWVLFMDLFKVWMRIRLYRSGQALYGVANALYWKSSERQNSHTWQFWNIKIPKPPYISSLKIIGFLHFLNFLGPSEKN